MEVQMLTPEMLVSRLADYCKDVLMTDWVPIRSLKKSGPGEVMIMVRGDDKVVIGTVDTPPPILMDACKDVVQWYDSSKTEIVE
jgi:hypothetical protein